MKLFKNKRKKGFFITLSFILLLAIALGACAIYLGDYYKADYESIEAFLSVNGMEYSKKESGNFVFEPENATIGFIFYPGGKVEAEAYLPLMASLSSLGILCIGVEMPFNLAVFDINAADGIIEDYPSVESWYIGGHSLGGSMAAEYLSRHSEDFDGIVLLGSYSTANLSDKSIKALSVYGSEDGVINRRKYEDNLSNMPSEFSEIVIEGGCHAYFGMYGEQDGDGNATISAEEQIELTAISIFQFMQ